MDIANLLTFVQNFFPYGFLKIAILLVVGMYLVFAAVIVKQESLIARMVEIPYSPLLRVIVIVHLIASLSVFFSALFFL